VLLLLASVVASPPSCGIANDFSTCVSSALACFLSWEGVVEREFQMGGVVEAVEAVMDLCWDVVELRFILARKRLEGRV